MTNPPLPGRRIVVVGNSGSGKTTMARALAGLLGIPHVELDSLFWGPNWTPRADFGERLQEAAAGDAWAADGHYRAYRDILWSRADTIVWLDIPLSASMIRLLWRTTRRMVTREELWNGNREPFGEMFTSKSLLWYALSTYRRRRREIVSGLETDAYRGLSVVHLRSAREVRHWLSIVAQSTTPITSR
jgi:adenylate kinase family enzyme